MKPEELVFAVVRWIDSAVMASTWRDREEAISRVETIMSEQIVSAGILVHETPTAIMLAVSLNVEVDDIQGAILIPRHAITDMRLVKVDHQ